MDPKILIAYAGACSSTAEVARAIGESLCKKSVTVDVRSAREIADLDGYRAVVIGSAIRFGRWLPESVEFVKSNRARLREIPVAFFSVHILAMDESEESRKRRMLYTAPVRNLLTPKAEAFFPGRIDPSRLSPLERMMARAVKAPKQDLRDWNAIRIWADGLLPIFFHDQCDLDDSGPNHDGAQLHRLGGGIIDLRRG